jgi:hypothetical protein
VSPRTKSWIALVTFILVVPFAAALPLAAGLAVLVVALALYGAFQATLRCPHCGGLLVERRVAGMTIYVPLAPPICGRCGSNLDSRTSEQHPPASHES